MPATCITVATPRSVGARSAVTRLANPLLLAVLVAGCGFQLRGMPDLPESVGSIYVKGSVLVADEIEILLGDQRARMTDVRAEADTVIAVRDERYLRRVLSVDADTGKEREFELVYLLTFEVNRGDGSPVIRAQTVRLRRDYVFDDDAIIGKSREENELRDEMKREAAAQIVRRLAAALPP